MGTWKEPTRLNFANPIPMKIGDERLPEMFNPSYDTIFIVHGWLSGPWIMNDVIESNCNAVLFYFWKQKRRCWNAASTLLNAPPPLPLTHTSLSTRTVLYSVSQGRTFRAVTCVIEQDRKRLRGPENPYVDNHVLKWFKQARDKRVPVSGPLLRAKAEHFTYELGKTDFKASAGGLDGFKQRKGVFFKAVRGERGAVDVRSAENWNWLYQGRKDGETVTEAALAVDNWE
ncbi:unnamed protein product [Timema podura]|uniref:HTH CENPB-type domain-containing protein n=1 Tax=Timema podura TaxID=61482 RepID=A0ABN7P2T6_TIMPD|nr:unnamed protein product [Timema podura]